MFALRVVVVACLVSFTVACATAPPDPVLVAPDVQLTGYWAKEHETEGTSLQLGAPLDGVYRVRFSSAGCLGHEQSEVSAVVEGTWLRLGASVTEYSGTSYSRLAIVRYGSRLYLMPEPYLARFHEALEARIDSRQWAFMLRTSALARLSAIP